MKKLVHLFGNKSSLNLDSNGTEGSVVRVRTLKSPILARFLSNRASTYPVFRELPPPVLKKIFLYFTERDLVKSFELSRKLSRKPPWILGHVCRQWRAIAQAIPDLWSHLPPVFLGTLTKYDIDKIFASLSELLHRCSGTPISFFLHNEIVDPLEYPIIDLLVAHCRQWENISLEVSGITIRRFLKIEGQLNSLHSLEFSLRGRGEPVVKLFESAPGLRTVRVNNLVSPGMLRLPWMQLTSYEDTTAFGDGVYKVFHSNSSLQHLKFSPICDEVLDFLPQIEWMPLVIPHLTTLNIEFWTSRYKIMSLFDNLTLPALHTLVLKFSKYDDVMDVELVNMITRSLCDLKHLTFHGRNSPIQQFLTVMPSLTALDINDPDPELIRKLSQFQGDEWTVVPCLRSLTIHISKVHPSSKFPYRYFEALSRLAGIRSDAVSAFRDDQPSLPMLKTFKIALHGIESEAGCLSHFYYASLEPPTTEMELQSANKIAELYTLVNNPVILYPSSSITASELMEARQILALTSPDGDDLLCAWDRRRQLYAEVVTGLKDLLKSDPQSVAGIYLSGIDYPLYRGFKVSFTEQHRQEISDFRHAVARWRSKLTTIAPVLKWDWDDDGYLVYISYKDRQLTRPTPEFKSQRLAYHDILPDELPAAQSFGHLKLEELPGQTLLLETIRVSQAGKE